MNDNRLTDFQKFYLDDARISKASNQGKKYRIWIYYYQTFLEDYLSIFEWKNIPDNIPQYALEWCLLRNGQFVMFYKDSVIRDIDNQIIDMSHYVARAFTTQLYDEYKQPISITTQPIFPNGSGFEELRDDSLFVYCYNNVSGTSSLNDILFYVKMLTEIEVSIELTCKQLRQPYIFEGTKGSKQTITQLMKKIDDGNVEYFVLNKDFMKDGNLTLHNLLGVEASKRIDSLYMLKEKYLQAWYTQIGTHPNINNKSERLTENESIGFNEIGNLHVNGKLQMRKDFCRRFNEKKMSNYPDIEVNFSSSIREVAKEEREDIEYGNDYREDIEVGDE